MPDILSLFVSNEAAMRFIKKTAKVTYVLLIVNGFITLMNLLDWYKYIDNIPVASHSKHYFFYYRAWLALYLAHIIFLITGSVYNYKAFALLKDADAAGDDSLVTTSFKYFYHAYVLFLSGSCLLIFDKGYRLFI